MPQGLENEIKEAVKRFGRGLTEDQRDELEFLIILWLGMKYETR